MRLHEVFYSVQGEGIYIGVPTVFVRLNGCNIRCKWCDTVYAQDIFGGEELSPTEIRSRVVKESYAAKWVCITGGEPLFQVRELEDLVKLLHEREYQVEIETNGVLPLPEWYEQVDSWCADIKCPSSGAAGKSLDNVWLHTRTQDQVKFVVADEEDLTFVEQMLRRYEKCKPTILISPVINLIQKSGTRKDYLISGLWLQRCVEFVKEHNLRFSLQIHKFIWEADKRGV